MTHLNIAKISKSGATRRLDAEFFMSEGMKSAEIVSNFPRTTALSKIASWITQGPNPQFVQDGIPSLNGKNIYFGTTKADEPNFVSHETFNALKNYALKQNDIVITLKHATKIGRSWIITDDEAKIFSRNLGVIRLRKDSPMNCAALLFYLWSDHAQRILDRMATGGTSGQITLAISWLRTLRVPILEDNLQNELEDYSEEYQNMMLESEMRYLQAEDLLLEEVGLKGFKPRHRLFYVTNLSKTLRACRIDAEYFQPAYDDVIKKITEYDNDYAKLLGYVDNINPDFDPTKHPNKVFSYVELSDIDESIGVVRSTSDVKGEDAPSRARRILRKDDVIVSRVEGSLGKIALVSREHEGSLASTGFFQFRPKKMLPETLLVLSKSAILQTQLKKECTGTILASVPSESLKRILVPIIPCGVQQKVASLVQQSHQVGRKAKNLIEEAKLKVDNAIEVGSHA